MASIREFPAKGTFSPAFITMISPTATSSGATCSTASGESLPREAGVEDEVVSGCVNMTSQIHVKVTKVFYDSTVSKILELVENASSRKSKAENFITKFAKYYTPIVV